MHATSSCTIFSVFQSITHHITHVAFIRHFHKRKLWFRTCSLRWFTLYHSGNRPLKDKACAVENENEIERENKNKDGSHCNEILKIGKLVNADYRIIFFGWVC